MSIVGDQHRLTVGYVHRHRPRQANVGIGVILLDIAQDFLLAHLKAEGLFRELVAFKGGTALRKLFAGHTGRFSTDLDFAVRGMDDDRETAARLIAETAAGELGPFRYAPHQRRGRWEIQVTTALGDVPFAMKLDVGPPCWLTPHERPSVEMEVHRVYGFPMPALPCMALEEVLAEKIARLARRSTARDAYDLVWCAETSPHSQFDRAYVRRLATLKVWSDMHGLTPTWPKALNAGVLDHVRWLDPRPADRWDDEQIGRLTQPPPTLADLDAKLRSHYAFIGNATPEERRWGGGESRDRGEVLRAVVALPNLAIPPSYLR